MRARSHSLWVALWVALVAACGGQSKPVTTTAPAAEPAPAAAPVAAPAPAAPPGPAALNDGAGPTAEQALEWAIAALRDEHVTKAQVEAWFAPEFLAQVSADEVLIAFSGLRQQLAKFDLAEASGTPPLDATAVLRSAAVSLSVSLTMTQTKPRQIAGLLFRPVSTVAPPTSYEGAVELLSKLGAKSQLFVAAIEKGRCAPVFAHNADARLAIGSTTKLWVLLALDEKLRTDKTLSWDTKLAIREESKSLPSGTMQNDAAGTEHTLRHYATQMISISDNTATDHLVDYIGVPRVERALTLAKHGKPMLNIPFLRTRELFGLKIAATPEELAAYRKGAPVNKRKLLAELRRRPIDLAKAVEEWKAPRALDIEWFANGKDLCNTLAVLGERGNFDPQSELLRALGQNPGVEIDKAQWRYVGFKGGSEPGVLHLAFLLQRADGKWFAVIAAVNDDARLIDEGTALAAGTGALATLGAAAGK